MELLTNMWINKHDYPIVSFRSEPEKKLCVEFTGILFHVAVSASVQRAFQSHQHKYKVKITNVTTTKRSNEVWTRQQSWDRNQRG
jgi:phage-related protein